MQFDVNTALGIESKTSLNNCVYASEIVSDIYDFLNYFLDYLSYDAIEIFFDFLNKTTN